MQRQSIIIATLFAGLLPASPASAQINQPVPPPPLPAPTAQTAAFTGEPALHGPMAGGLPREDWMVECARRLNNRPGMAALESRATCEKWWAFYQGGGAPHPTYGYAVPVSVTETTEICPERTIVRQRIIRRQILLHPHKLHDKRVKLIKL